MNSGLVYVEGKLRRVQQQMDTSTIKHGILDYPNKPIRAAGKMCHTEQFFFFFFLFYENTIYLYLLFMAFGMLNIRYICLVCWKKLTVLKQ